MTIASSTYIGDADYYCDGTADQTEINLAITALAATGGGTVHLNNGTFNLSATIVGDSGICIELESGTTIEKNCNDYAISCVGTAGTHKSYFSVYGPGTITQNASDTNVKALINLSYCDNCAVSSCSLISAFYVSIFYDHCTNLSINFNTFDSGRIGIYDNTGGASDSYINIAANTFSNMSSTDGVSAVTLIGNYNVISNNIMRDCTSTGYAYGISSAGSHNLIANNSISEVVGSTTINFGIILAGNYNNISSNRVTDNGAYGIYVDSGISNSITNNYCLNNGSDTGLANTNGNNFYDGGTDTQFSG